MASIEADKGWAWVACFGSFVALFLETGVVKALGVLLPVLQQQFATQIWIIGLVVSLVPGIGAITCPLVGALCKRFTARPVVMCLSFLSAMGLIVGSFATSIPVLCFSCLLTGFSIGVEAVVLGELATYFHSKFSIANAIAQIGLSAGIMAVPPMTQLFIDTYGWRGSMLLLGGINLHLVVAGAVLKPVDLHLRTGLTEKQSEQSANTTILLPQKNEHNSPLVNDIVYYLDLTLFQNAVCISMFIYSFGIGYCLTGWLIYLVPFAIDVGLPPFKAVSLSSCGGVGSLFGSLIYPLLVKRFSCKQIVLSSSFLMVLAFAVYPLLGMYNSYIGLICTSIVYGCAKATAALCTFQIVKDGIEDKRVTNAVLWMSVTHSIGAILSGFLSGWTFDETGNFTISFFILSGMSLLTVCPLTILTT